MGQIHSDYPAQANPAIEPQVPSTISKSLTGTGSTDIFNGSEAGILLSIGIKVTTNVTGTPTATIDITADGGTTRSFPLYGGSTTWVNSFGALAGRDVGSEGQSVGDKAALILGIPYKTSLQVAINVTGAGSAGVVEATVLRGVEL